MKIQSMQFKVLITLLSAMLAITMFIGGLSIYEVDQFVQRQTEDYINVTCEKDASQINDIFGDMEKSVHIMESYVLGLINSKADIRDVKKQADILERSDEMFIDVANNTDGAVAYYFRFTPELSHNTFGLFYSKVKKRTDLFVSSLLTYRYMINLILSMWDGTGNHMKQESLSGCCHTTIRTTT